MGILDFLFDDPARSRLPSPADALPRPRRADPRSGAPHRPGHPARRPVAGGHPHGDLRHGLLLGRGEGILEDSRRVTTAVGYAGGSTPTDLWGGLQRPNRPRGGGARGLRPGARLARSLLRAFWEAHDPDPGDAPGQRQGHPVPVRDLRHGSRRAGAGRGVADRVPGAARCGRLRSITTEIALAGPFYFAEDYHQQYLDKNPNGYCPDTGPASRARSGWESRLARLRQAGRGPLHASGSL